MLKRLDQLLSPSSRDRQEGIAPLLAELERREQLLAQVHEQLPDMLRPHCTQASLNEGKLRLAVTSPAWAYQLRLLAPNILPPLSKMHNITIYEAQVYVIPQQMPWEDTSQSSPPAQLSATTRAHLREVAASCEDALLAQRFLQLARH